MSMYNKIKGKYEWSLPEVIKLCKEAKKIGIDTVEIRVGESDYLIKIEEKTPNKESNKQE